MTVVYTLNLSDNKDFTPTETEGITAFLEAHGIKPKQFILGTDLTVYATDQHTYELHTWQAPDGYPVCENCPSCVKQERVVKPLAAAVPVTSDLAWISEEHTAALTTKKESTMSEQPNEQTDSAADQVDEPDNEAPTQQDGADGGTDTADAGSSDGGDAAAAGDGQTDSDSQDGGTQQQ